MGTFGEDRLSRGGLRGTDLVPEGQNVADCIHLQDGMHSAFSSLKILVDILAEEFDDVNQSVGGGYTVLEEDSVRIVRSRLIVKVLE